MQQSLLTNQQTDEPVNGETARKRRLCLTQNENTRQRDIAFFEDGTEASNVSVEMLKAAPDLLAALQLLVAVRERKRTSSGVDGRYDVARAAIRKATAMNPDAPQE